jgi:transposase
MATQTRKPYPSEAPGEEWAFVAPYLTLLTEDALQRKHDLREVYNALRWIVRTGAQRRTLPTNFPPRAAAGALWAQQTQPWIAAGESEGIVHDLCMLLRWADGRADQPTAVILDPEHAGERSWRRVRQAQTPQGPQQTRRRRHVKAPTGTARDPGERTRMRAGGKPWPRRCKRRPVRPSRACISSPSRA